MNKIAFISKINSFKKGTWFHAEWDSDMEKHLTQQAKDAGHTAYKHVTGACRQGISYKNIKTVKERINKEGSDNSGTTSKLPWGQWVENYEGLLITHNDKDYARLYTGPKKLSSTYFLDGKQVSYKELMISGLFKPSTFKSSDKLECMTLKLESITDIYQKTK